MWYILDEQNNPIRSCVRTFCLWSYNRDISVKQEYIGEVYISTVFLGLDNGLSYSKPLLWETMIIGGKHNMYRERYTSYENAVKGHEEAIELVKKQS